MLHFKGFVYKGCYSDCEDKLKRYGSVKPVSMLFKDLDRHNAYAFVDREASAKYIAQILAAVFKTVRVEQDSPVSWTIAWSLAEPKSTQIRCLYKNKDGAEFAYYDKEWHKHDRVS